MMYIIGEILVDDRVMETRFSCDVKRCRGACCTLPGAKGAPLRDEELVFIEQALPHAERYLSEQSRVEIRKSGFFEGSPGSYTTTCIERNDCVFVFYEDDIARCSLEKAYEDSLTDWRKPISCHLFPFRIAPGDQPSLYYEELRECRDALVKGEQKSISLAEFGKSALVREFGEEWYDQFVQVQIGQSSGD